MLFLSNLVFDFFFTFHFGFGSNSFLRVHLPLIFTETYVLNYTLGKSSKSTCQFCTVQYIYNFQILQDYKQLMEVWDGCLEENLETEVGSRIIGCRAQTMSFKFFLRNQLKLHNLFHHRQPIESTSSRSKSAVESHKTASHLLKHRKKWDLKKTVMRFLIR